MSRGSGQTWKQDLIEIVVFCGLVAALIGGSFYGQRWILDAVTPDVPAEVSRQSTNSFARRVYEEPRVTRIDAMRRAVGAEGPGPDRRTESEVRSDYELTWAHGRAVATRARALRIGAGIAGLVLLAWVCARVGYPWFSAILGAVPMLGFLFVLRVLWLLSIVFVRSRSRAGHHAVPQASS